MAETAVRPLVTEDVGTVDRGEPAGLWRGILQAVGRNWLFAVLIGAGSALRLIVMLAYRPALPLPQDSVMYVQRAVTNSAGDSFHPFLYPLILKPFIAIGHLWWVVIAQHVAAVGMAVLLYLLLRRLRVHPIVGALALVPLLLDGYQLNIEHHVLSETFFQLTMVGALALLVWWDRPHPIAAAGAGVLIAASSLIRFPGLALIVAAVVYVLIRRFGWLRLVTLVASFLLALGIYSVWFNGESGTVGITNRDGFFLYGRVVSFADCAEVPVPERLLVFCPPEGAPDPEKKGLFTSGLPDAIRRDPSNNDEAMEFARRMIMAKPASYLSAIFSDFLMYFRTDDPHEREPETGVWLFRDSLRKTHQTISGIELRFSSNSSLGSFMGNYQEAAWSYGPLLALILILGIGGSIIGWGTGFGRPLAPEALLFTLASVGVLLFPAVFAVYHIRYVLPALPLLGPAGALGLSALTRRYLHTRADRATDPAADES